MSYSTVTKVTSMFRNLKIDQPNSALTTAEIQEFLDETQVEINSCLSRFYDIPNIGSDTQIVLGKVEYLIVAGIVDDILNNYAEAKLKPQYDKKGRELLAKYMPTLDKKSCEWCDPMALLPDTTYKGLPSTTSSISVSQQNTRQFKKGIDTW